MLEAAEEAAERKGAALSELLDILVRSAIAQREDVKALQAQTQTRYEEIMDPAKLPELQELARRLNDTLRTYVPDASLELPWRAEELIEIPAPRADPRLVEDGYPSTVDRAGHGLQRAFLLTLLQHLAVAQSPLPSPDADASAGGDGSGADAAGEVDQLRNVASPNLILGIEEPELYQHPNRQRHLARILLELASGGIAGVAERTQIIYATHSPLLVDVGHAEQVRVLRKQASDSGKPKVTKVAYTTLDEVAKVIEQADGKPAGAYSGESLRPRLATLMTPWVNEGFFASVAVLVEGEQDRAAVLGVAKADGHDFESKGISIIPCNGKNNLDRPAAIFRSLGIPVYVIWDSDKGGKNPRPESNHKLLRLCGAEAEDWPHRITDQYACFEQKLETTLRSELGPNLFDSLLEECRDRFGYDEDERALKCPLVVQAIIEKGRGQGGETTTLSQIVSQIVALLPAVTKEMENR